MFQEKVIDEAEVNRILALEESHYLDLKATDIRPGKLTEFVSAFANTGGGELFIGIAEEEIDGSKVRHWRGFGDMEAANGHIQAIEGTAVLGNHYQAVFLQCPEADGYVLHLTIFKTKDILLASNNTAYIRRNAQKLPVQDEVGLIRLRLDKGVVTFEDEAVNIEADVITNSTQIISFMLDVVPSAEPDSWVKSQHLLTAGKPTVAGTLLFADEPQAALPKRSAIKIYRYRTRDEEGSRDTLDFDPITVEGCLYDLIGEAVHRTKVIVEDITKLGEKGLEAIEYPHETLHEIITNAVLHRDYSITMDVYVRIFDDRIEVESPGCLPGHVTQDNILAEQSARNPKIVRLINKFPDPPNKDVGEGLNTAFQAMEKLRLKPPQISVSHNSVTVYIRHTPLASPHETVIGHLKSHDEITNRVARELTGIRSENTMKEVFLALKKRNLIEPVPGKKGNASAWQSCGDADEDGTS